jgi:hypothetical protein
VQGDAATICDDHHAPQATDERCEAQLEADEFDIASPKDLQGKRPRWRSAGANSVARW